jgi:hypothetical protein
MKHPLPGITSSANANDIPPRHPLTDGSTNTVLRQRCVELEEEVKNLKVEMSGYTALFQFFTSITEEGRSLSNSNATPSVSQSRVPHGSTPEDHTQGVNMHNNHQTQATQTEPLLVRADSLLPKKQLASCGSQTEATMDVVYFADGKGASGSPKLTLEGYSTQTKAILTIDDQDKDIKPPKTEVDNLDMTLSQSKSISDSPVREKDTKRTVKIGE